MPLDPSIPLQVKTPDLGTLASFLDLGSRKLALDKARETYSADVSQRQSESALARTTADVAAQTAPYKVSQAQAQAGSAQANWSVDKLNEMRAHVSNAAQQIQSLMNDPQVDRKKIVSAISESLVNSGAPTSAFAQAFQGLPEDGASQSDFQKFLAQSLARNQAVSSQIDKLYPNPNFIGTGAEAIPVSPGNPQMTNLPPGTPQGPGVKMGIPPTAFLGTPGQPTPSGNPTQYVRTPDGRLVQVEIPAAGQSAGPMQIPAGETPQTQAQFNQMRTDALTASQRVPELHNINRTIIDQVDKGTITGTFGSLVQRAASATGYKLSGEQPVDLNILGKMLAQSNLQMATAMGMGTNMGKEMVQEANGTTEYSPQALRLIASRNDALAEGTRMYQSGMEKAVANSPIKEFAVRQFNQDWANAMGRDGVDALRLKNAVDAGDSKEIQEIVKQAGGKGSKGAQALYQRLQSIMRLQ